MDIESPPGLPGGSVDDPEVTMDYEDQNNLGLDPPALLSGSKSLTTPTQQANEIIAAEAKELTEGETVYLISEGWWAKWCSHTKFKQQPAAGDAISSAEQQQQSGSTSAPAAAAGSDVEDDSDDDEAPGSIDNSDIVAADTSKTDLRSNLEEGKDFVIVTSDSWSLLHGWYGGGPSITRHAVMEGLAHNTKRPRVMLYPWKLQVCWGGKPNEVKTVEAEKHGTVRSLKERACAAFGADPSKVEIWDYFNHGKYANLEGLLDQDLDSARILEDQAILLDDKDNPLPENNTTSSSPIMMSFSGARGLGRMSSLQEDQSIQRVDGRPGLVGLQNLGNTCFMNSSLQCLMHTVPILRVFLSGQYEADVNTTNPLGLKGQLARALGSLIAHVWKPGVGSVSPRAFKSKIAQFAPQFSGYQQHDSQEFLAFLLDGLHEDINRIQHKPYIEEPDSEGVPDEQLAATAWTNYRLRNDSHIVDHFQGLYKSTLVCPQCSYSSVKFDPFMYLSLPLPESRVKQLTAILLHADGAAAPREYGLEVPQSGTLKDVYTALARVAALPPLTHPGQQMVAAKLRQGSSFGGGLTTFEDPSTRVTELGRDLSGEVLLVYYYKDPQHGPGGVRSSSGTTTTIAAVGSGGDVDITSSGGRDGGGGGSAGDAAAAAEGGEQQQQQVVNNQKVLVYHRQSTGPGGHHDKFSAPLLLWLPLSETYDPQLHVRKLGGSSSNNSSSSKPLFGTAGGRLLGGSDVEYALSEEAPLWRHVQQMLQPFRAPHTLWQQTPAPPAAAAGGDSGEQQQQEQATAAMSVAMSAEQQQQQQPAASTGPADVSMAAAASTVAPAADCNSPDPCCTSQPTAAAAAAAAAAEQQQQCGGGGGGGVSSSDGGGGAAGAGGVWGSDGGDGQQQQHPHHTRQHNQRSSSNNKAAAGGSEAGDSHEGAGGGAGGGGGGGDGNNSTWGSQGSDGPAASDMEMADLMCDEGGEGGVGGAEGQQEQEQQEQQQQQMPVDGISRAASQQNLAAAAAGGGGDDAMEAEGGEGLHASNAAAAAAAAQMLGGGGGGSSSGGVAGAPHSSPTAKAGGGAVGGSSSLLGSGGGVPVTPLDMWSMQGEQQQQQQQQDRERDQDQQQAAAAAAAAAAAVSGPGLSPYYQLKLAHDNGVNTVVQSWNAAHFHPKHHHTTFMLDWYKGEGVKVTHAQYMAAAAAAAAAEGTQQQGRGDDAAGQQQQQQQPSHAAAAAAADDSCPPHHPAANSSQQPPQFWLPDTTGLEASTPLPDDATHEIVGRYVIDCMQQPQRDPSVGPIHAARSDPRGKVVSLEECVEAFLQPEQLSEADEWYCPKCKTHVQADKKLDLWALPEVLVVHLKRFSYTRWNRDKLDTQVRFPLEGLDLSRYVSSFSTSSKQEATTPPLAQQQQQEEASGTNSNSNNNTTTPAAAAPVYDCYAVSNHYGGLGGGHYTAYAQMPDDKQWYLFDDSRVEDVRPEGVQSRAAYLLFYRRRAAAAADAPDLVPQLLEAREAHAARAAAEAAAAAAAAEAEAHAAQESAAAAAGGGGGEPSAMDADGGADAATAGDGTELTVIPAAAGSPLHDGWGSPVVGTPAAAAAAGGVAGEGGIGGALLGISSPAPAAAAGGVVRGRGGAVEDSSDTSTSRVNTAVLEEGDSSDGSSSRPRGVGIGRGGGGGWAVGAGAVQQQRQAAEVAAAAEAVDSWGPLAAGGAGVSSSAGAAAVGVTPQRQARPSDQDLDLDDADMADRDV